MIPACFYTGSFDTQRVIASRVVRAGMGIQLISSHLERREICVGVERAQSFLSSRKPTENTLWIQCTSCVGLRDYRNQNDRARSTLARVFPRCSK